MSYYYTSKDNRLYYSYSMSYNATVAYNDGYKPKSKWTKKAMLEAIREYLQLETVYEDDVIINIMKAVEKLKKEKIFHYLLEYKESHHTGKFYNLTDFYGIDEIMLEVFIDENNLSGDNE